MYSPVVLCIARCCIVKYFNPKLTNMFSLNTIYYVAELNGYKKQEEITPHTIKHVFTDENDEVMAEIRTNSMGKTSWSIHDHLNELITSYLEDGTTLLQS